MRDVLGYAVAALIGLWTATLQAWSPQWWAGVVIASAVALLTSLHLLWTNLPEAARMDRRGSNFLIGVIVCATIFDSWYFLTRSAPPPPTLPPPPAAAVAKAPGPQPPAPPKPKVPWVTDEENEQQKKQGRTLSTYSPKELLEMESNDENVDVFKGRWIKLDYPVEKVPIPFSSDKKEYYVVVITFGFVGVARDTLEALFDPKKYGDRLVNLRKGDQLKAVCQIASIDRGKPYNAFGGRDDVMIAANCELL
jgi:hypothetical protein